MSSFIRDGLPLNVLFKQRLLVSPRLCSKTFASPVSFHSSVMVLIS